MLKSRSGEIGRRARFRAVWAYARVGSTPTFGTKKCEWNHSHFFFTGKAFGEMTRLWGQIWSFHQLLSLESNTLATPFCHNQI